MRPQSSPLLALLLAGPAAVRAGINWDIFEHGVVPSFKWSRPFPDDGSDPGGFHVNCKASKTFHAKMYKLSDLPADPPSGLAPWHHAIDEFLAKTPEFMGSWDGVDHKDQDREIVVMEYKDVPASVKHFIEEQQADLTESNKRKWWFGVFEKPKTDGEKIHGTVRPTVMPYYSSEPTPIPVAGEDKQKDDHQEAAYTQSNHGQIDPEHLQEHQKPGKPIPDENKILVFPGGAIYEILPLWVANGSGVCERELHNLPKYKHQAQDHCVIAWVTDHTKPHRDLGKRDMQFTIEAMAVTETDEGKYTRLMWERMYRAVKRNERRQQREERQKAKKEMEGGRVRDEL